MAEEEKKRELTVREAGRLGGKRVVELYGHEFYQEIGSKGGARTSELYGPEFYGEIGSKGGTSTRDRHGPEFYQKIGKKGGAKIKELIKRGREAVAKQIAESAIE